MTGLMNDSNRRFGEFVCFSKVKGVDAKHTSIGIAAIARLVLADHRELALPLYTFTSLIYFLPSGSLMRTEFVK